MMKFSIERLVQTLIKNGKCKEDERDIVVYGLKMGIEIFFNILTTIVLAIIFGMVIETLVFSISFFFLRSYCGGVHARNGLACYYFSVAILVAVLTVQKHELVSLNFTYISLLVGIVVILIIAPLGDKNKPLDALEQNVYRKKVYLILSINVLIFWVSQLLLLESVMINISLSIMVVSASLILGQVKNKFDKEK